MGRKVRAGQRLQQLRERLQLNQVEATLVKGSGGIWIQFAKELEGKKGVKPAFPIPDRNPSL